MNLFHHNQDTRQKSGDGFVDMAKVRGTTILFEGQVLAIRHASLLLCLAFVLSDKQPDTVVNAID